MHGDSTFSPDWLALREAADHAARSQALVFEIATRLPPSRLRFIVDLGAGTGSNLRYLAPRLGGRQRWLLVDQDPAALDGIGDEMARWSRRHGLTIRGGAGTWSVSGEAVRLDIETCRMDLSPLDAGMLGEADVVTGSALLDLVSESWLRSLVASCRATGAAVIFALTYDGRFECSPPDEEDGRVRELVNRHQRTDKGFGPALGPSAAERCARCLIEAGYRVRAEPSDWRLEVETGELQRRLIDGWAAAAEAAAPDRLAAVASWRARRQAAVDRGMSRIVVGHRDVAGWIDP